MAMLVTERKKRSLLATVFLVEILKGMALTLRRLFSKPVTRQYPTEKRQPFLGFRGQHALARDPESGACRCVACMRCAAVCPSQCITIRFRQEEEGGPRIVERYEIEAFRCIYCGYCEEVCPVNAIVLTEVYEYSAYDRRANFFDQERLLANWDRFLAESGHDPAQYVNPFWQQRGVEERMLAAGRRKPVPADWRPAGQVVGMARRNKPLEKREEASC